MKKTLFSILLSVALLLSLISCELITGGQDQTPPTNDTDITDSVCVHNWAEATCDAAKSCTKCGETDGTALAHDWAEATCKAAKTCTRCGLTDGGIGDHNYSEPTCTSAAICKTCGIWYGLSNGHDFAPATCEAPRTCKICGFEKGERAHEFTAATCITAKTCTKCGETASDPIGHKLKSRVTAPTCNVDGYEEMYCTVCDYCDVVSVLPMLGHSGLSYVYNGDATALSDGTATLACPYCDYAVTKTLVGSADLISEAFAGKKISILGDSISTYTNYSNGPAADTTNSTIRDNLVWYGYNPSQPTFGGSSVDSTWWQMTINTIGASCLVNNSNSGESVFEALTGRCMQLHDDTGENAGETPDIIFIYLGTNDNHRTMGNVSVLNMEDIARKAANANYSPISLAEAYAIMLYRVKATYPDAEIYCLTNLERSDINKTNTRAVSKVIRECVDLFDGVYLADICVDAGISVDNPDYLTYIPADQGGKSIHPGTEGMKAISQVVLTALIENSRYMTEDFYDLLPENEE